MSEEKTKEITRHLGTADADIMIKKLESWGIPSKGITLLLDSNKLLDSIHIPKGTVNDLNRFQDELSSLSLVGRSYAIKEVGEYIAIDPRLKSDYQPRRKIQQ